MTTMIISIPASNPALRDNLEHDLAAFGHVHRPANSRDIDELKLVMELVALPISIAGGVAGLFTFFWQLKDRAAQQGQRTSIRLTRDGQPPVNLDDADEAFLHQLLGIDP